MFLRDFRLGLGVFGAYHPGNLIELVGKSTVKMSIWTPSKGCQLNPN